MAKTTRITMKEADLDKLEKLVRAQVREGTRVTMPWVKSTLVSCGYDASETICTELRNRVVNSKSVVRTKQSGNYGK